MNKLLSFLADHSLHDLEIMHGVKARRSDDCSKFSLNYDQFESKPGDEIAELCRGVVLRPDTFAGRVLLKSDDWANSSLGKCVYLARTMKRFYNVGEAHAFSISWDSKNLHVMDKLDGTMTALYWDDLKGSWCVATRSVSEANLPFGVSEFESGMFNMTFSDLFWLGYSNVISHVRDVSFLNKEYTYVFELTSHLNKIVVDYKRPEISLIALIHNESGNEIDVYSDEGMRFISAPRPKRWELSSLSAVAAYVNSQPPDKCEGAVVYDGFGRVKIKSAAYVLAHRAKDVLDTSPVSALMSILDGTVDDVLPLLDETIKGRFEKLREAVGSYFSHLDAVFNDAISKTSSRKEFAIFVNASGEWTAPLFQMYKIFERDQSKMVMVSDWIESSVKNGNFSTSMCQELLKRISKHA